jgi:hypothetical protein
VSLGVPGPRPRWTRPADPVRPAPVGAGHPGQRAAVKHLYKRRA